MWNDIENITKAGIGKIELAKANPFKFFMRSCMAGAYLAIAAILSFSLGALFQHDVALSKTLVAGSFGIGLALIVFLGGELFTGNCFTTIMPVYTKRKKLTELVPAWVICYAGNCVGSAIICTLFISSGALKDALTTYLTSSIAAKLNFDLMELFIKAILCNFIVCAGAYAGMKIQDSMTKLVFLVIIVMAFVLPGFEHCIANAGTFTMGLTLLGSSMDWSLLPLHMLIATIGNIIGGSILIGLPVYLTFKD
ncbi:MAG: formate/nitrite transporter family protein [Erysipelotrichaceae bacterium]|nr:formate/nitrite transporter family protein [Erysipelotrichaceae bacterium]